MKKLFIAAMAAAGLLFYSCNKDSSYYHSLGLMYPTSYQSAVIYGDQTIDSLVFYTTDNFELSAYESPWIMIPDSKKSGKIPNVYHRIVYVSTVIEFKPNDTGKIRTGGIRVRSYGEDNWDNTAYATYYQTYWHNISRPQPTYSYEDRVITGAAFRDSLKALQTADTLVFYAHDEWTISGGSFVHADGLKRGSAGQQRVPLRIDANLIGGERKDTLILTSDKGVSTRIEYIQKKAEASIEE